MHVYPSFCPCSLIVGYEIEDLCLNDHLLLFTLLFCQYKIVASSLSYSLLYSLILTPSLSVWLTSALFFHLRQSPSSIDSLSSKMIMVYFIEKELVLSLDREKTVVFWIPNYLTHEVRHTDCVGWMRGGGGREGNRLRGRKTRRMNRNEWSEGCPPRLSWDSTDGLLRWTEERSESRTTVHTFFAFTSNSTCGPREDCLGGRTTSSGVGFAKSFNFKSLF